MKETIDLISSIIELVKLLASIGIFNFIMNLIIQNEVFVLIISIMIAVFIITIKTNLRRNNQLQTEVAMYQRKMSICENQLYFSMENSYKRNEDASTLNTIVMRELKEYVNSIAHILSRYVKEEITVSIRFFKKVENPIVESTLNVLAFSENCGIDREKLFKDEKNNSKKVKDNTEYDLILNKDAQGVTDYFYESNLKKLNKKMLKIGHGGYKNTTPNWELYYNGKIVVPICMENKFLFFKKQNNDIDIEGFLCADVKKSGAFSDKKKYFLLYLMESYANKLYIILNKYSYYLDNISKGVTHDKNFRRKKQKNI